MENYPFRYVSVSHAAAGAGFVGITLERKEGVQFVAILTVDDARRLLIELPEQVRIAGQISN
jgi:hypothetical protein